MQAKRFFQTPLAIGAIALAVAAAVVIGGLATRHSQAERSGNGGRRQRRASVSLVA
jgi:hypothetical protein